MNVYIGSDIHIICWLIIRTPGFEEAIYTANYVRLLIFVTVSRFQVNKLLTYFDM